MNSRGAVSRVGLLIESLADAFWFEVVAAVAHAARSREVGLVVFVGGTLDGSTRADHHDNRAFELVKSSGVDGLLAPPLGKCAGVERLAEFYGQIAPVPMVGLTAVVPGMPSVCTDNRADMARAVRHLIEVHGSRRIAFVCGPEDNAEALLRFEGFCQTLRECQIPLDHSLVASGDFTELSGREAVEQLRASCRLNFDALVCANDSMALGAIRQLRSHGLLVPEHRAVVAFDDVPEGRWGKPSLTTSRQSLTEIAAQALDDLLGLIAGVSLAGDRVVAGQLMVRESCGCLAAQADGHPSPPEPVEGEALLDRLIHSLQGVSPGGSEALSRHWRSRLAGSMAWQVEEGSGQFLALLEDYLKAAAVTGKALGDWQRVVSALQWALSSEQRAGEQDTFYAAQALVGQAAERQQAMFRMRSECLVEASLDAGSEVLGSFSGERMFDALEKRLPGMGIESCLVVIQDSGAPEAEADERLEFAYLEGKREPLPAGGKKWFNDERRPLRQAIDAVGVWTVATLYSGERGFGFLYLQLGPSLGQVYDWLRQQVSVALEGARMLAQLEADEALRGQWEQRELSAQLQAAARVQQSVLPTELCVPGLSIAAKMIAASEVGGDCFDVIASPGGCWLSIGDVAGHGLGPGVVVMSLLSSLSALVVTRPFAQPRDLLAELNAILFDVVRRRLRRDEHATLTLIRYEETGRCVFAGAHEDILVYRAGRGVVQFVDTPGPWLGILPDIRDATEQGEFWLEPGDVLLLYTDGVLEAMNSERQQFGMDRLVGALRTHAQQPVERIVEAIASAVRTWTGQPEDDVTLVVVRQLQYRASLPVVGPVPKRID